MAGGLKIGSLSDDMSKFVTFTDDDDNNTQDIKDDLDLNDLDENEDDDTGGVLKDIDTSTIPEEHKGIFDKLVSAVKDANKQIGDLRKQADTTKVLEQLATIQKTQPKTEKDANTQHQKAEKLADKLKEAFESDDFYAPHFIKIASVLDEIVESIGGIKENFESARKQGFREKVVDFVTTRKLPQQVVVQMDAIASSYGPQMYSDLNKLLKFALVDLGLDPNTTFTTNKLNKEPADKKRKNIVEMSGFRKRSSDTQKRKVSSMADAFAQAEEDLAGE